jgi:serine/threonine protein kinase
MWTVMEPDAPVIEGLQILELAGRGGKSLVYKAWQRTLDRIVAVKVLSGEAICGEDGIKRFQKEAKLTSALEHPNIVKIFAFGVSGAGQPYLVMEFLDGHSLATELRENGRLPLQKFKSVFLPLLAALNCAHQAGLIHRDIKPQNIMLCPVTEPGGTVKLLDFGIARSFSEGEQGIQNLTTSGNLIGTPAYMSPEQCWEKQLDGRSDLYSLACVMYESIAGEPPFSGETPLEVIQKQTFEPIPTVAELSRKANIDRQLAEVVLAGLSKDPGLRPQNALDFAHKLDKALESIKIDPLPACQDIRKLAGLILTLITAFGLCFWLVLASLKGSSASKNAVSTLDLSSSKSAQDARIEAMYKKSLALAERAHGQNSEQILSPLSDLKTFYVKQKRPEALPLIKRLLSIKEKTLLPESRDVAESLEDLAQFYRQRNQPGDQSLAGPLLKRSLEIKEKVLGINDLDIAWSQIRLAEYYEDAGRFPEAETLFRKALAIRENVQAADDAITTVSQSRLGVGSDAREVLCRDVGHSLSLLAECCEKQGKLKDAEKLYQRSLEARKKSLPPGAPEISQTVKALARCRQQQ